MIHDIHDSWLVLFFNAFNVLLDLGSAWLGLIAWWFDVNIAGSRAKSTSSGICNKEENESECVYHYHSYQSVDKCFRRRHISGLWKSAFKHPNGSSKTHRDEHRRWPRLRLDHFPSTTQTSPHAQKATPACGRYQWIWFRIASLLRGFSRWRSCQSTKAAITGHYGYGIGQCNHCHRRKANSWIEAVVRATRCDYGHRPAQGPVAGHRSQVCENFKKFSNWIGFGSLPCSVRIDWYWNWNCWNCNAAGCCSSIVWLYYCTSMTMTHGLLQLHFAIFTAMHFLTCSKIIYPPLHHHWLLTNRYQPRHLFNHYWLSPWLC